MSEKVLGFKAENKSRIKFSDSKKVYIRVPEKDLVSVRLASESVDLKALKHFLDNCSYTIKFGIRYVEKKEIIEFAEKAGQVKKNEEV